MSRETNVRDLHQKMNSSLYDRNIPSRNLQPYIDARPVATKYNVLPLGDKRKHIHVPLIQQPTYSNKSVYNPSDSAPWSGYNVDLETNLRYSAKYAPSSRSDLYDYRFVTGHALREKAPNFLDQNKNVAIEREDKQIFYNSTRDKTPIIK